MKKDSWKIVSECIGEETLDIEGQKGWEKIPIVLRKVDELNKDTVQGAGDTAKDYHAKATEDPDPAKIKTGKEKEKGKPSGDPLEKSLKEKPKEV